MKIQCDVCEKDEATLFCVADEAALCAACDYRVHHANKLAVKHQRFSLHHLSPKEAPLCDICQDRTAFLFCRQDRAVLCSECDICIHKANEHTQKHARFLLTGIKPSANPTPYSDQPPPASSEYMNLANNKSSKVKKPENPTTVKPVCSIGPAPACTPPAAKGTTAQSTAAEKVDNSAMASFDCSVSASSISEYLEMLPGWHVEDLLDSSSSPSPYGLYKNGEEEEEEEEALQFWNEGEIEGNYVSGFCIGKRGFGVPQMLVHNQSYPSTAQMLPNGLNEQSKDFVATYDDNNNNNNITVMMGTRKRSEDKDNCFAVPQFNPHLSVSKRSRSFYYSQI